MWTYFTETIHIFPIKKILSLFKFSILRNRQAENQIFSVSYIFKLSQQLRKFTPNTFSEIWIQCNNDYFLKIKNADIKLNLYIKEQIFDYTMQGMKSEVKLTRLNIILIVNCQRNLAISKYAII